MIKQWEVFTQKSSSRTDSVRISLNLRGNFALNQKAFEVLGEPKAIELLFDKVNKLIGMRACDPELKHAYNIRKQGKSQSYLIGGKAFCNYYGLKPMATVVFQEPEVDEDKVLTLDLRKVKEFPQKKRVSATQEAVVVAPPTQTEQVNTQQPVLLVSQS